MKTRYARDTHDAPRSHTLREKRNAMMCPYVETSPNVAQTVRSLGNEFQPVWQRTESIKKKKWSKEQWKRKYKKILQKSDRQQ